VDTFGERFKWFRIRAGLDQKPLADLLGVHRNTIVAWENSQYLPRQSDMVETLAKKLFLSEAETNQLLAAAHYPPKYHVPETVSLIATQPAANLSSPYMGFSAFTPAEQIAARTKYLEGMCQRYSTVALPIGPAEGFSLQAIFQSLKLRRDPLAAEDLVYEKRRAQLGESRDQNDDLRRVAREAELPVVIAIDGEDALHKSPQGRMVVLGGPGTGKSTLLMSLLGNQARKARIDSNTSIPIFLSLPDLARSGKSLQDYLLLLTKDLRVDERYALVLWKAIEGGRAFVFLDSLDEVAPSLRPSMIRMINELAAGAGNSWIIGSRLTEYKGGQFKQGQFTEWELQPMNHTLRLQLARLLVPELYRLLHISDENRANRSSTFVKLLETHPQATAWGENPLLFSLAAVVFVRTGTISASRITLYEQVIEAVFETRQQDPIRRKLLLRVISDLALELYITKGRTFSLDDLLDLLPIVCQRRHENWVPEEIAHRIIASGMLDVLAHETYGFRHQAFQEYLAAVELAQRLVNRDQALRDETWTFVWSKRTYSRWTEVLRLMLGVLVQKHRREGAQQATRWLIALVRQRLGLEGDIGNLGLTLALESLTEVSERKLGNWREVQGEKVEAEIVRSWLVALFSEVGGNRRRRQRDQLQFLANKVSHSGENTVKIALEQLIMKLNAEDWQVRETAVRALEGLREHVPVEPLLALLHDKNWEVRGAVVQLLGNLGERTSVDALLNILSDADWHVRWNAEFYLGNLGEHAPVAQLMLYLHSEEWRRRTSAASVLTRLGMCVPVGSFLADLHESDSERRWCAVRVIGALGADAPIEPLFTALSDQDRRVRSAAANALGTLKAYVPVERLVVALNDSNQNVRLAALEALGRREANMIMVVGPTTTLSFQPMATTASSEGTSIPGERGAQTPVEPLLKMLQDKDKFVRSQAVEALKDLSERVPVEPLVAALDDEYEFVRSNVAKALGNVHVGVPAEPLLKGLYDVSRSVREAAAEALVKMGVDPPEEFLLVNIERELTLVCTAALQILWSMAEHVPVEVFQGLLNNDDAQVRAKAAKALGQSGDQAFVEPLLIVLKDEDRWVRCAAAEALGKLGDGVPVEPLLSALNDDSLVRQEVAKILGKLGERVRLEPFLEALDNEDASVRAAALDVLEALGTRTPLEPLLRALNDAHASVRCQAAWALGKLGKRAPIEPLLAALQDESDGVRWAAKEALVKLAENVSLEPLLVLVRSDDGKRREAAWMVLKDLGKPIPVELLAQALTGTNERVCVAAIGVIGELDEPILLEHLLNFLSDEDQSIRLATTHPLSRIAEYHLYEGLDGDPTRSILSALIHTLRKFAEHIPLELLVRALRSEQWYTRAVAVEVLGQLKDRAPIDALLSTFFGVHEGPDMWGLAVSVVRALGRLGAYTPIERLFTILHTGQTFERWTVAEVLGKMGERVLAEPLLAALDDEDNNVRVAVIRALGQMEGRVPIEPIVAALGDDEESVRDAAIKVLRRTHPDALLALVPEAIASVQRGTSGNILSSISQGVIAEVIGNVGYSTPNLLEKLTHLLDWPYWQVQMKAAQALGKIRRNIPNVAIRRLLELRHDPQSRAVRLAANDALAEILSLETGIEDD
jgi:HEAT repeat protein/transcriptional regulator with XRE-family HTH domain